MPLYIDNAQDEIMRRNQASLTFYQGVSDMLRAHFASDPIPNDLDKQLLVLIGGRIEVLKADLAATDYWKGEGA